MADNTNPYGVDLAIDPNTGDLIAWPNGALATREGPENAVQAVLLWVKTSPGEVPLHPDVGSSFNSKLLGGKFNVVALQGMAYTEFKNILASDARFLTIRNLAVEQVNGQNGARAHVRATLYLTGGEQVEVLDFAQGVFSTVADPVDGDFGESPVDPLDDPEFFADELEADDLTDVDPIASAVEDLDFGVIDPADL
jgi:hypothetical protein